MEPVTLEEVLLGEPEVILAKEVVTAGVLFGPGQAQAQVRVTSPALPYKVNMGALMEKVMKPLSDPLNSLHSLVVCLWQSAYPPHRYRETDRPASEASGCRKAFLWG